MAKMTVELEREIALTKLATVDFGLMVENLKCANKKKYVTLESGGVSSRIGSDLAFRPFHWRWRTRTCWAQ